MIYRLPSHWHESRWSPQRNDSGALKNASAQREQPLTCVLTHVDALHGEESKQGSGGEANKCLSSLYNHSILVHVRAISRDVEQKKGLWRLFEVHIWSGEPWQNTDSSVAKQMDRFVSKSVGMMGVKGRFWQFFSCRKQFYQHCVTLSWLYIWSCVK